MNDQPIKRLLIENHIVYFTVPFVAGNTISGLSHNRFWLHKQLNSSTNTLSLALLPNLSRPRLSMKVVSTATAGSKTRSENGLSGLPFTGGCCHGEQASSRQGQKIARKIDLSPAAGRNSSSRFDLSGIISELEKP